MKEQDKTPEQLSEVDTDKLPENEFRVMIVKMIQDLGKRMEAQIENGHVRPIFEMKWRPRAFSRVSTGDSHILSSCDMNDEHA